MIVPMKKVVLLAQECDRIQALTALRNAGVMQIIDTGNVSAATGETAGICEKERKTMEYLLRIAAEKKIAPKTLPLSGAEIIQQASELAERKNLLAGNMEKLSRRQAQLAPWGEFRFESLEELRKNGLTVTLIEGTQEQYEAGRAEEHFCCELISEAEGKFYFVLIGESEPDPQIFSGLQLAPEDDPAELRARLAGLQKECDGIDSRLEEFAASAESARARVEHMESELEFRQAADALTAAGPVVYLTGFVPEPALEILRQSAQENGWGLVISDPEPEEEVPVLIEESRFTRIVRPLFDFLGIMPGYREMDVSGGVLIFFTIFYAMIVGDAGYGTLFLLGALTGKYLLRKKTAARRPLNFLILLSAATVVWGALSGNWFGIPGIPGLKCLSDPAVKDSNVQAFCFLLAFAQLCTGRLWRAIHEGGIRSYIRHLGWALILLGNLILTLKLLVWPGAFPVWMYVVYGAGLLAVMCADVDWRNPADCFQFPFSVIGSFTDVLSYIRLFAVGMAGSCIASSFNNMGSDIAHISVWCIPFGIITILLGHLLNISLNIMSVLVHGVRLNTLEFSNHTGLSWSGQAFKPFKNHNKMEEK